MLCNWIKTKSMKNNKISKKWNKKKLIVNNGIKRINKQIKKANNRNQI